MNGHQKNEVIVSDEYKGVFRLEIQTDFSSVKSVEKFKNPPKGKNAGLIKFNNEIFYSYNEGVFQYDKNSKTFKSEPFLSKFTKNAEYVTGKMILDENNRLWTFSEKNIHLFTPEKLSKSLKNRIIPVPTILNNAMSGYENSNKIEDNL